MMWKVTGRKHLLIAKQLAMLIAKMSSWMGVYSCLHVLNQAGKNRSRVSSWSWLSCFFSFPQVNVSTMLLAPIFSLISLEDETKVQVTVGWRAVHYLSLTTQDLYTLMIRKLPELCLFFFLDSIISALPWSFSWAGSKIMWSGFWSQTLSQVIYCFHFP